MKLLITLCLLLLSAPALSNLRIEKTHKSQYMIIGDLYSAPYTETAHNLMSMPHTNVINWPTTDGVMLFLTFKALRISIKPILLSKNLTGNQYPWSHLYQVAESSNVLNSGIILTSIDTKDMDTVGVFVCDYRLSKAAWPCIEFTTANGSIELPPPPPPPELVCNLTNAIDLRHGNLSINAVQNNRAVATAYVSCNRSATVQISIAPDTQGQVKLSGVTGLRSNLYVEGVGGGKAVNVSAGPGQKAVKFESVLASDGSLTAGTFQGSSYAVLSFP